MDPAAIGVTAAGMLAIGFVLWYFFGQREAAVAGTSESGVQEIQVTVQGGYEPDVIVVEQGKPVRLQFYRNETAACSETVVFRDFGLNRELPSYQTTSVEFVPDQTGEFTFTCGMNMMRGKLIVEPAR